MAGNVFRRSGVHVYKQLDGSLFLIIHFRTDTRDGLRVAYGPPEPVTWEQMQAEGLALIVRGINEEVQESVFNPTYVSITSDEEDAAFESQHLAVSIRRDMPDMLTLSPLKRVTLTGRVSDPDNEISFPLPGTAASFFDVLNRAFQHAT